MNIGSKYEGILTQLEIENKFDGYYVYSHLYKGKTIYIGKGSYRRATSWNRRPYKHLKKEIIVKILGRFDEDEDLALAYEKAIIQLFKGANQCQYNSDEFFSGKRRGEGEKEMAIDTEVTYEIEICDTQEVIYENEYEYSRNFDDYLNSIEIKNIYPPSFMLNMISDKEIRNNTERFLNNLEDIEVEELYDLYTLYEQLLHERMNEIEDIYSTRIIYRYLRKIFK